MFHQARQASNLLWQKYLELIQKVRSIFPQYCRQLPFKQNSNYKLTVECQQISKFDQQIRTFKIDSFGRQLLIVLTNKFVKLNYYFITKMAEPFNEEQFREVFTVTQKIKNKLQPFLAKYKEHNMTWIMKSLEQLHRMFFDAKIDIIFRFNSIFGIKFIFDTGDVILINLIEIYFLPKILQIAGYDLKGPDDKRGINYFLNHGYTNQTPDVQKFGYNYVRMASQFIFNAAIVKPNRLFDSQTYNQPSEFSLALKRLQVGGWKIYATPAYYKQGTAQTLKGLFQKSLEGLEDVSDIYINYFNAVFKRIITVQRPFQGRLDPKKILESGDTYVTANIVGLCSDVIRSNNLKYMKNGLYLLNYLIKWGDIQAAYQVNCTNLLDQLLYEVANAEEKSKLLSRGKSIFKKSKANQQEKQQLYNQLLKDIQFWSLCYPNGIKIKNRQSKIKMVHDQFRSKLQYEFPINKNLKQDKAIFDEQVKKNKTRNNLLLNDLNDVDPQPQSFVIEKVADVQEPTPQGNSYQDLSKELNEIELFINTLCQNKGKLAAKISRILAFNKNFQPRFEQADLAEDQVDQLLGKWDGLVQRISKISPLLKQYQSQQLTFQQLCEIITNKKSSPKKATMPKQEQSQPATTKQIKQQSIPSKKQVAPKQSKVEEPKPVQVKKQKAPQNNKQSNKEKQPINLPILQRLETDLQKQKLLYGRTFNQRPVDPSQASKVRANQKQPASVPTILRHQPNSQREKYQKIGSQKPANTSQASKKLGQPSIKAKVEQMTPIKTMVQSPVKQKDDHGISILPSVSKQSIQKEHQQNSMKSGTVQKKSIQLAQGIDIKPASHTIIKDENQKITQALFKEHQSSRKVPHAVESSRKEERAVQVKELMKKDQIEFDQHANNEIFEQSQNKQGVKIPRSLKNAAGSYKNQNYTPLLSKQAPQPQFSQLKQSRASSRRSQKVKFQDSKIKFQDSKISVEANREDQGDLIMTPDINPLQVSYHEITGVEDFIRQSTTLSFKKCFEGDNYLFGPERNNKRFWLANETVSLIKPVGSRKQSRNKDSSVSIPQILNERNKKYQEELKYVQEKKDRKINELQSKIKHLQNNGKVLTEKLYEQQKEIKQIRANSEADNSRVNKNSILEDQEHVFKAKLATFHKNKSVKQRSFYDESSKKEPKFLDPLGKIVNIRKYSTYFEEFQGQKQRKNLLKNKELLLKNDQIEFGCMTKREKENLIVTFYITPANDLDGLVTRVSPSNSLEIQVQPKNIPSIRKGKQQKVIATISIKELPFALPNIEFSYSLGGKLDSQNFLIPCSFHKFIYLNPVKQNEIGRRFQRKDKILRGQEVPYSKKLLKTFDNLSDYFPNGTLLNGGYPNDNGEVQYGGRGQWKGDQFFVRVMVKQNQFLYVQTVAEENNILQQFYLSLVTNLLMKNIELKEM